MPQSDATPPQGPKSGNITDPITAGEEILARAKSVAQRIAEKVRKLAEDKNPLPNDGEKDGKDVPNS